MLRNSEIQRLAEFIQHGSPRDSISPWLTPFAPDIVYILINQHNPHAVLAPLFTSETARLIVSYETYQIHRDHITRLTPSQRARIQCPENDANLVNMVRSLKSSTVVVVYDSRSHHEDDPLLDQLIPNVTHCFGSVDLLEDSSPSRLLDAFRRHAVRADLQISNTKKRIFFTPSAAGKTAIKVSIVVPVYNVEKWLEQCLDSLTRQTLTEIEVIVVNDGSPDGSETIARSFVSRFPDKVRLINQPNGGCASARMTGLRAARGEYVGFVDGDDWVDPEMYEHLYSLAHFHQADFSQCGYYEDYTSSGQSYPIPESFAEVIEKPWTLIGIRPTVWRRLYKRDFLEAQDIRFPEHIRRFDDLPFCFLTFAKANRVAFTNKPYYHYRLERPGQDTAINDQRLEIHFEIFDWLRQESKEWISRKIEKQLINVEIATHTWALTLLRQDLRRRYMSRMAHHLLSRRVHCPSRDVFSVFYKRGTEGLKLLARLAALKLLTSNS